VILIPSSLFREIQLSKREQHSYQLTSPGCQVICYSMKWGPEVKQLISRALREDIGTGDVTTELLVNSRLKARAVIYAKSSGVLAGIGLAESVFKCLDKRIKFRSLRRNGQKIRKRDKVAEIVGPARAILTAERTVLNFLQHLSGVATLTSKFVEKVRNTKVIICDTRKTTPGWRVLEKYAVRMGGGKNHRFGLYDQILIKDNHIKASGSIQKAIRLTVRQNRGKLSVEVEASNLKEVQEALSAGSGWIMLDNLTPSDTKKAIGLIRNCSKEKERRIIIEVSGKVNLRNVRGLAKLGPDLISVGQLTHSAPASDFSLKILEVW